jgi:hypothetical protein
MTVKIVFNELSLNKPFDSKQVAMKGMTAFTETLRTAIEKGAKRELCTRDDFDFLQLSLGYQIVQWRNDPAVDKDDRRFLRSLQDKTYTPLPDIVDASVETNYLGSRAIGLEYAFSCEALAVSFQSETQWDCDLLKLSVTELKENGELCNKTVNVFHASSEQHVLNHTSWIVGQSRINIVIGSDLWERRNELLPNLEFCEETARQLIALQSGHVMLRPVIKRLFELEHHCKDWRTGAFSPGTLPCSTTPESQVTLNQYGRERTFMCPDGQERIFSWHVRLTPMAWRIYIIPIAPDSLNLTGKIIIGYIGPHLRTAQFH